MNHPLTPPRKIIIYYRLSNTISVEVAQALDAELQANHVQVIQVTTENDADLPELLKTGGIDLLIAIGGDGTILRAAWQCVECKVPVMGVNAGNLGFLTTVHRNDWRNYLGRILAGDYWFEERMMLQCGHYRNEQLLQKWDALNEVVVCRGELVQAINLRVKVDGFDLATYIADGVIVASPSGSTAYALAANGPVMPPSIRNLLLVPIAPHRTFDKAVVLSDASTVSILVRSKNDVVLSTDGLKPIKLALHDEVRVSAKTQPVYFARFQEQGYFYDYLHKYLEKYLRIPEK